MADARLSEILRILHAHGVDFIVVGGMAAVKRKLGRPKDLLMALQIEATLDELKKKDVP